MAKHWKRFYCEQCYKRFDEGLENHCPDCGKDVRKLLDLYTKIVIERPHLAGLTMPELFERMFECLKMLESNQSEPGISRRKFRGQSDKRSKSG